MNLALVAELMDNFVRDELLASEARYTDLLMEYHVQRRVVEDLRVREGRYLQHIDMVERMNGGMIAQLAREQDQYHELQQYTVDLRQRMHELRIRYERTRDHYRSLRDQVGLLDGDSEYERNVEELLSFVEDPYDSDVTDIASP